MLAIILSFLQGTGLNFVKTNWKPIFIISCILIFGLGCYNSGKRSVRAEWQQSIIEAQGKARQNETDNQIFNATMRGNNYAVQKTLDNEYANFINGLQLSTSGNMPKSTSPARGTNGTPLDCGISPNREAISRERAAVAKQAKHQALILLQLQDWQLNHPK